MTLAICAYGFLASVLPVWVLLVPRDYISSFLKIGTIAALVFVMLVGAVFVAVPVAILLFVAAVVGGLMRRYMRR